MSLGLKALAAGGLAGLLGRPRPARAQSFGVNVVYIVIDTTRADNMSFLGYGRNTTPTLKALAAQSCVFRRAISPSNWTLPSYASLLSGKIPLHHDFNSPVRSANRLQGTLAGQFATLGYKTISIQTNAMVSRLDDEFQERYLYEFADPSIIDGFAVSKATDWLNQGGAGSPFFMFLGLYCPHQKYYTHDSFASFIGDPVYTKEAFHSILTSFAPVPQEHLLLPGDIPPQAMARIGKPKQGGFYEDSRLYRAAYDSEIRYSDQQISRLLDTMKALGIFDSSLIVVTADHGEMMDKGDMYFSHGTDFNLDQVHVPLIVKLPYQNQGRVINDWVGTMGIGPALLDYLGMDSSGQEGTSLLPLITGQGTGAPDDIVAYSDVYRMLNINDYGLLYKSMLALIRGGYKFTKTVFVNDPDRSGEAYTLHDLESDPRETVDLSVGRADLLAEFKEYVSLRYPGI